MTEWGRHRTLHGDSNFILFRPRRWTFLEKHMKVVRIVFSSAHFKLYILQSESHTMCSGWAAIDEISLVPTDSPAERTFGLCILSLSTSRSLCFRPLMETVAENNQRFFPTSNSLLTFPLFFSKLFLSLSERVLWHLIPACCWLLSAFRIFKWVHNRVIWRIQTIEWLEARKRLMQRKRHTNPFQSFGLNACAIRICTIGYTLHMQSDAFRLFRL